MRFALAGNPNSGKTTLFNTLTGATAHVGNWPGVTVDKREGVYKKLNEKVDIIDLPGIYSLSPYTPEEVVARNFIINEHPDCIINIVDATNIERNLYLTTQILEMDVPVIVALNMIDEVKKNGTKIDAEKIEKALGVKVVQISALRNEGIELLMEEAQRVASKKRNGTSTLEGEPYYNIVTKLQEELNNRGVSNSLFVATKIVEGDETFSKEYPDLVELISKDKEAYKDNDFAGDFEGMVADARYRYITNNVSNFVKRKEETNELSKSDKIDKVLTHRIWSIPIFIVLMFVIFHFTFSEDLFGINTFSKGNAGVKGETAINIFTGMGYEDIYTEELQGVIYETAEDDEDKVNVAVEAVASAANLEAVAQGEEAVYEDGVALEDLEIEDQEKVLVALGGDVSEVDPVIGIPSPGVFLQSWMGFVTGKVIDLGAMISETWPAFLSGLLVDGILTGLDAILSFLPQILLLFLFIAILEDSGYMARVAFIMDRAFRGLGLSGKAFIPLLMGFGCSVPAMMSAKTLEDEHERDLTIRLTPFFSCGAKAPIWAMLAVCVAGSFLGDIFVFSIYLLGIVVAIIFALIIKAFGKQKEVPPFIMELPNYHAPQFKNLMAHLWEKLKHFVYKASTIITLAIVLIWFLSNFGWAFWKGMVGIDDSILASLGNVFKYLLYPLGFTWGPEGWKYSVAVITGLIAKEDVVATMATLGLTESTIALTNAQIYSFAALNLFTFPCFAAIATAKGESSKKGFWITTLWWLGGSYAVSLIIFWLLWFYENILVLGILITVVLLAILAALIIFIVKKRKKTLNAVV